MAIDTLPDLLNAVSKSENPRSIVAYPLGNTSEGRTLTYKQLRQQAWDNSQALNKIAGFTSGSVILLHFSDHLDNIIWFWSVLYAGCIPALSTPFTNDLEQRKRHIAHLHKLLENPLCLVRRDSLDQFDGTLRTVTVESLQKHPGNAKICEIGQDAGATAFIMLTSGSTGNSKAVEIRHRQALASVAGKARALESAPESSLLNWIGLDHVAGLVEIHIRAMYENLDQIHVQAPDVIADPLRLLYLIERHRTSVSFAPNFFLAKLIRELEGGEVHSRLDLKCLRCIVSGGESNLVETCKAVSEQLAEFGAPKNVVAPGFGMTETCAGSIYNTDCPRHDLESKVEFAALGTPIKGLEMRIVPQTSSAELYQEIGDLQVRGEVVFNGYFNDAISTAASFTEDGWFKTGDQGYIDSAGKLNLVGRTKEIMTINGVKHVPSEIETAIENARIPGVVPSCVICFSFRPLQSPTEQICIVYKPSYSDDDSESRVFVLDSIVKIVMLQTGSRPQVLPLSDQFPQKSTLGKISRSKIRAGLEKGEFREDEEANGILVRTYKKAHHKQPENDLERQLLRVIESVLELNEDEIGVETPVFELGVTSIDLIRVHRQIETELGLAKIPILLVLTHPTVRELARALRDFKPKSAYDPVVTLHSGGPKTPLWLIHPGVGEILVFLNLARFVSDRPVHCLRARGFDEGQEYFQSIEEAVDVYCSYIKKTQPRGPYAIAGYSFGAMLAFEVAKQLERKGDEVRFLGCFNLPPYIKFRMKQLTWPQCLINLSYFLALISEDFAHKISHMIEQLPQDKAVAYIMGVAEPARISELALTAESLKNWANLASAMQSMATEYEPSGKIRNIDVFYCDPLKVVADSKAEWKEKHLDRWADFSSTAPVFHEVGGSHYTILSAEHVLGFHKTLHEALRSRGL